MVLHLVVMMVHLMVEYLEYLGFIDGTDDGATLGSNDGAFDGRVLGVSDGAMLGSEESASTQNLYSRNGVPTQSEPLPFSRWQTKPSIQSSSFSQFPAHFFNRQVLTSAMFSKTPTPDPP